MRLRKSILYCLFPTAVAAFFILFDLPVPPVSHLETATWIIGGEPIDLPVSVQDCWNIAKDDTVKQYWLPFVLNIRNLEPPGLNGRRLVDVNVCKFNLPLCLLMFGSIEIDEVFDVWEAEGETRRYSFYFAGLSRPPFMSFRLVREDYLCEAVTETTSKLTITVAIDPGILTKLFGFIVESGFRDLFERLAPELLLENIQAGNLPPLVS